MAEYTDEQHERLTQVRIEIAAIQEWRIGVDEKLDALSTQVSTSKQEILEAVNNGHETRGFSLRDVDTKWIILGVLALIAPDAITAFLAP